MILGVIIACALNTVEVNPDNCMLLISEVVFDNEQMCQEAVSKALQEPGLLINLLALDMKIYNTECINIGGSYI